MASETFSVVALPYSCATNSPFHVSLFVTPRLVPTGAKGELQNFAVFSNWAQQLLDGDTTFELRDQAGTIPATAQLDEIDPALWVAMFDPTTAVVANKVPDWSGRHWRTFSAAAVHDSAKLVHLLSMFAKQTSMPEPDQNPFTAPLAELGMVQPEKKNMPAYYDEKRITSRFDDALGDGDSAGKVSLDEVGKVIRRVGRSDPLTAILYHLHRVRRFYERPESAEPYQERPTQGATPEPVQLHTPDFHERCALVGDHREVLRRLGLVIDLRVDTPSKLRTSTWLSATIAPGGDSSACRPARTACERAGDDLVSRPNGKDWTQGRLRIGGDGFALLDMEADASGLKLERFLWTLPRLSLAKANGDPAHGAPPALRSNGFTVVRTDRAIGTQGRLGRQHTLSSDLDSNKKPLLHTEDVVRGFRVEVWDAKRQQWNSVHSRTITVTVAGHGPVLVDIDDEGMVQGTPATETTGVKKSPIHVHEALFGWEGWSLSAPKPGMRVVHDNGDEKPQDPATPPSDMQTPIGITSRIKPKTLPRLRYGRSYAFRAWAVDLAGNVRPHELGNALTSGAGSAAVSGVSSALPAVGKFVQPLRRWLINTLKDADAAVEPVANDRVLREFAPDTLARIARRRAGDIDRSAATVRRGALVERRFTEVLRDKAIDLAAVSEVVLAADTVTAVKPFLRWDPVQPPAMVSRQRYTAGESLRQVVIRSRVTQDLSTLAITVTPPVTTSERHLAPPKSSQSQAELHGEFDDAIGSTSTTDHTKWLAAALREDGTLFDATVPRLDDPSQATPQPGIELVAPPGQPKKALPKPGLAPEPGYYVIHDTPQLALPYLPDPIARGISLVFPDAGLDRPMPFPFATEGFTARYEGGPWPAIKPFRLVLEGGDELRGDLDGSTLRIALPAGDIQRFRLSSSLDRSTDLDVLGPWCMLPETLRNDGDVAEAAADGWLWALAPYEDVTLVHAVPRPLEAPRPTMLKPGRTAGSTASMLIGAVDVHGPSTDSLTAEATWTEWADDLNMAKPEQQPNRSVAFTIKIHEAEDLALLSKTDSKLTLPNTPAVWTHKNVHQFPDTKHRLVNYRFRATTRFREYFEPAELAPGTPPGPPDPFDAPVDDGRSVLGPVVQVSVPSTARPAVPIVRGVLPLFRWDEGTEPEQPLGYRRRRRAGLRIYLERPWFSSGDGELLGVLLARDGDTETSWVSQWGADPAWITTPVGSRAMATMQLEDFLHEHAVDDRPLGAQPVAAPALLPIGTMPDHPHVTVLGYDVAFNEDRGLWYADIAVDPGATFWPFVRLAVARYQPDSLAGYHLSPPVRCDYAQLTPERIASVSRTDVRHVRVVVSGPVGVRRFRTLSSIPNFVGENRTMVARLQRRDPAIATDLGWETLDVVELAIRGQGPRPWDVSWVGALSAPVDIPLSRPGEGDGDWRVAIEEWERFPGDPASLAPDASDEQVWERRLIYADEFVL